MEDKKEERSLVNVLARLKKDGFTYDFTVTDQSTLSTMDGKQSFGVKEVTIVDHYRFEGESNPDDMSILYAINTSKGVKGTISNSYGPYADEGIDNFIKQVEDLGKNLDKKDK